MLQCSQRYFFDSDPELRISMTSESLPWFCASPDGMLTLLATEVRDCLAACAASVAFLALAAASFQYFMGGIRYFGSIGIG